MRTIEIIFWGMACFQKTDGGFRVMLPDGRTNNLPGVETHYPCYWIRPSGKPPKNKKGTWFTNGENNFLMFLPGDLTITGLNATPMVTTDFDDRLPSLTKSDSAFTLASRSNRESMLELTIDRGVLSAHKFPKGAIGTKWTVQAEDNADVVFDCGITSLTLDPATVQVTIANSARSDMMMPGHNHFRLYRKLATVKEGALEVTEPLIPPQKGGAAIIDQPPDFGIDSPFVDCSNSFYP